MTELGNNSFTVKPEDVQTGRVRLFVDFHSRIWNEKMTRIDTVYIEYLPAELEKSKKRGETIFGGIFI